MQVFSVLMLDKHVQGSALAVPRCPFHVCLSDVRCSVSSCQKKHVDRTNSIVYSCFSCLDPESSRRRHVCAMAFDGQRGVRRKDHDQCDEMPDMTSARMLTCGERRRLTRPDGCLVTPNESHVRPRSGSGSHTGHLPPRCVPTTSHGSSPDARRAKRKSGAPTRSIQER